MNKRHFLQALLASGGAVLVAQRLLRPTATPASQATSSTASSAASANGAGEPALPAADPQEEFELVMLQESELHPGFKHSERTQESSSAIQQLPNESHEQYLEKIRNFDADFPSDIFLSEANHKLLLPTLARLERVQNYVGHANFNLLGFDEMLFFARNYPDIGKFETAETTFMEEFFMPMPRPTVSSATRSPRIWETASISEMSRKSAAPAIT